MYDLLTDWLSHGGSFCNVTSRNEVGASYSTELSLRLADGENKLREIQYISPY